MAKHLGLALLVLNIYQGMQTQWGFTHLFCVLAESAGLCGGEMADSIREHERLHLKKKNHVTVIPIDETVYVPEKTSSSFTFLLLLSDN